MKLNLNPKEFLALYNKLHDHFSAPEHGVEGEDVHLRQLYNRMKACIIAALTNKAVDPLDAFFQREQEKIDELKSQNDEIKKAVQDPDFFKPQILTDDENEISMDDREYPKRKGPPPPIVPKVGKHRGRR